MTTRPVEQLQVRLAAKAFCGGGHDPAAAKNSVWAVGGCVSKTGEKGEPGRFTVADADDTLGRRTQFDKEAGIITAAFYSPVATCFT